MPKRLAVEHVGDKTIISAVKVAYVTPQAKQRAAKTPPACELDDAPHKPIPWGSDPRFAVCAHCGKHLRRDDESGAYI